MKLLLGLGNPGTPYAMNRHNVGFMYVDYMARLAETTWKYDKYMNAEVAQVELQPTINSQQTLLAKPQTFMNRSGESLKSIVIRHGLKPNDVFVVHDDLDIKLGDFKISFGKGPKLHNGIRSIEDHWKTDAFWRVRIGVESRTERIPGETYVLQNFTEDELPMLQTIFEKIKSHLLPFLKK